MQMLSDITVLELGRRVSTGYCGKLLVDAGLACALFHDENVRGVRAKLVQCDEIWSFNYEGEERGVGQGRSRAGRRCLDLDRA